MSSDSQTEELKQAIRDFEFHVDVAVALDEQEKREQWKSEVHNTFDTMRELVDKQRREIHSKVFSEIASQDESERSQIQQLRHADQEIDKFLDLVQTHLDAFGIGIGDRGDTEELEAQLFELRDASHRLAASLLAQEESVASWFAESFDQNA